MVKIVVVNGMPMVGKSQFVEYCLKELGIYGEEVSTVDFVKELAKLSGWDGVKRPRDRKFLSDLKDLLTEWNDVPYKKIIEARDRLQDRLDYLGYDTNKGIILVNINKINKLVKIRSPIYVPYSTLNNTGLLKCIKPKSIEIDGKVLSNYLIGLS